MKTDCKQVYSFGQPWAIKAAGQPFVYFDYNAAGDNTRVYSSIANDWERIYTYDLLGRKLTYTEGNIVENYAYTGNLLTLHTQQYYDNNVSTPITSQTTYTYNAHRLQSVNGQDEVPVVYHYDSYGRVDTLYDESGLVCYQYGNMGEITRETRIYTVPFLSNIIALSTQFEYDSWGRILNITYPDKEIVSYDYDCGGQLFKFYNNQNYTYLDSVQYNKFGAKTSQLYGNGIKTKYTYYPLTQRLDSLLTTYSGNTLSYLQYTYDSVGNILRVNSSYPMPQYQVTERYTYDSADQLLTAESTCNNNVLCSGAYSYNNWGKINTFTQQTTDPAINTFENKDYRYYFPSSSADMAQGQTSFAPIIKYDMQQNPQPLETCTYGINGSIRKRYDHPTQNTDYYYFNASGNLKACGTDMQISVYGYNSANTRTYKVNLFNANQWVNGQPQPIQPMVQSAMFYPNTYINFTQAGEYTKHYYNGTERICSRLGEQQVSISVENDQELLNYQHDTKEILRNAIGQHLYDEPTDMQEGDLIPLEYLQPCGNNNAVYYYHPNHLSSSMYVTDAQQSVVQSFLYAPYGEIISEYNTHVMGEAFPKYSFNAKELDEETGFYYYEARYYAPPTFISRDPLMSEKPWLTPYHYCSNNPVGRVDPSGMMDEGYITGDAADHATAQLNLSTNLTITRDPITGKLSASGEIKTAYDQDLFNAINDPSIIVKINATYSNKLSNGEEFIGGAFMGNSISDEKVFLLPDIMNNKPYERQTASKNIVITNQTVNPYDLSALDFSYNQLFTGASMAHEFMESYIGGQYSQITGIAADRACKNGCDRTIYNYAHSRAPKQPGWFEENGAIIKFKEYSSLRQYVKYVCNY